MKKIGFWTVMSCMAWAGTVHAKDSGFEVGARLGLGLPQGDAVGEDTDDEGGSSSNKLSDAISHKIPLQLDLGYRLNPQLMIGGYFQYAFATFNDDAEGCDIEGVSCSASVLRLGAQAIYHFTPITAGSAGWIGGGVGYEWLKMAVSFDEVKLDGSIRGFEFLNLQGGYDFVVSDKFRVGPYGLVSLARYSSSSATVTNGTESEELEEDIENKAFHAWVSFGVKATFGAL